MIDGLMLTFSGEELRTLLDDRVARHEAHARRWTSETLRTKEEETEDAPLLTEQMCEHEVERHTWRAAVLAFIRDHVEGGETYRLRAADLEYGELLPEKPGSVEQDEYEDHTRIGFNLERLVKCMDGLVGLTYALRRAADAEGGSAGRPLETVTSETEFRTTRIDVEDGPEIIHIERK